MRMRKWIGVMLLGSLAVALAAGCGDDGGGPTAPAITHVPESWSGVWTIGLQATICNTSYTLYDTTFTENICPGDSLQLDFPVDLGDSLCSDGTFTATERYMQLTCSGPIQEGDCVGTVTANLRVDINPTAGTLSGTGGIQVSWTSGLECPPYCVRITMTGNRIAGNPTCPLEKPAVSGSLLLDALSRVRRE